MCGRCGLGFVPVALALFSLATFVVTYIISRLRNDTSWFPAISDTADHSPESNVFGFLFNMCAAVALLTTFIRYLQLRHDADWNERDRQLLIRLNKVAMLFGILSSLGACIVANFQVLFEQLFLSKFKFDQVYFILAWFNFLWLSQFAACRLINKQLTSLKWVPSPYHRTFFISLLIYSYIDHTIHEVYNNF